MYVTPHCLLTNVLVLASCCPVQVSDLELTPDDAAVIASTIRAELARLSALPEVRTLWGLFWLFFMPAACAAAHPIQLHAAGLPLCTCLPSELNAGRSLPSRIPCRSTRPPPYRWHRRRRHLSDN